MSWFNLGARQDATRKYGKKSAVNSTTTMSSIGRGMDFNADFSESILSSPSLTSSLSSESGSEKFMAGKRNNVGLQYHDENRANIVAGFGVDDMLTDDGSAKRKMKENNVHTKKSRLKRQNSPAQKRKAKGENLVNADKSTIAAANHTTTSRTTRNMTKNKEAGDLLALVNRGHSDDIKYVVGRIQKHNSNLKFRSTFKFCVSIPPWHSAAVTRLKSWLEQIGFEEGAFGTGFAYFYCREFQELLNLFNQHKVNVEEEENKARQTQTRRRSKTLESAAIGYRRQKHTSIHTRSRTLEIMNPVLMEDEEFKPIGIERHLNQPIGLSIDTRFTELRVKDKEGLESPNTEPSTPFSITSPFSFSESGSKSGTYSSHYNAHNPSPLDGEFLSLVNSNLNIEVNSQDILQTATLQSSSSTLDSNKKGQRINDGHCTQPFQQYLKPDATANTPQGKTISLVDEKVAVVNYDDVNNQSETSTVIDTGDEFENQNESDHEIHGLASPVLETKKIGDGHWNFVHGKHEDGFSRILPAASSLSRKESGSLLNNHESPDLNKRMGYNDDDDEPGLIGGLLFNSSKLGTGDIGPENLQSMISGSCDDVSGYLTTYIGNSSDSHDNADISKQRKITRRSFSVPHFSRSNASNNDSTLTPCAAPQQHTLQDPVHFCTPQSIRLCQDQFSKFELSKGISPHVMKKLLDKFILQRAEVKSTCHQSPPTKINIRRVHSTSEIFINRQRESFSAFSDRDSFGGTLSKPTCIDMTNLTGDPIDSARKQLQQHTSSRQRQNETRDEGNNFDIKNQHTSDFHAETNFSDVKDIDFADVEMRNMRIVSDINYEKDMTERKLTQQKKKKSKYKRLSVVKNLQLHSYADQSSAFDISTSFSPTVPNRRGLRRSNCLNKEEIGHEGLSWSPRPVNDFRPNYQVVVVGGSFQQCYEEGSVPVVIAPSSTEKRVVNINLSPSDGSLMLRMYLPKDKSYKKIDLGVSWKCFKASPTGYLVCKNSSAPNTVYYFLRKHPSDWQQQKSMDEGHFSFSADESRIGTSMTDSIEVSLSHDVSHASLSGYDFANNVAMCSTNRSHSNLYHKDQDLAMEISMNASQIIIHDEETMMRHNDEELVEDDVILSSSNADWTNAGVVVLILSFLLETDTEFLSPHERRLSEQSNKNYILVCKAWAVSASVLDVKRLANFDLNKSSVLNYSKWCQSICQKYNWGKFLGQGACKDVYCVLDRNDNKTAISVMDIEDLRERDMEHLVTTELEISMLCSYLVTLNICPNLIKVHSIFRSKYPAPNNLWNNKGSAKPANVRNNTHPLPASKLGPTGNYQFICMEYCSSGDVEELIRQCTMLEVEDVRSFIFQMYFSLYCCRERLLLRHFDIKLLNFFVTEGRDLVKNTSVASEVTDYVDLIIAFGEQTFKLPLKADKPQLIKLADFGTSSVGNHELGSPITLSQYTTLENTPPEFLLLGTTARQSFASDTFSLGLSFLHLLTGYEPYEEMMKGVTCPEYLVKALGKLWLTHDSESPYNIIKELIDSLDNSEDDPDRPGSVLFDTLYRYMVLFSSAVRRDAHVEDTVNCHNHEKCQSIYYQNPVWQLFMNTLGMSGNAGVLKGRDAKKKAECLNQYRVDVEIWDLRTGSHERMALVRERLALLGESALFLLESMLHFDPSKRCSMGDALNDPIFDKFKVSTANPSDRSNQTFTFYRSSSDSLPMV